MVRLLIVLVTLAAFPRTVVGQQSRAYAGGVMDFVTQTHSDDQPLGGTTIGARVLFGVRVSTRVAIECEPSFGRTYSGEYTYRPAPSLIANVGTSRRDTFVPVQARIGLGALEPVVGIGLVHSTIGRHATIGDTVYFDDSRSDNDLAFIGGLDVAVKLGSSVYLVPTFRALVVPRGSYAPNDPLGSQTSTGSLTYRYGVGARVAF